MLAPEPRHVANVVGARQIDIFVDTACALLSTGHVVCWSPSEEYPAGSPRPSREVPGLVQAQQIALGSYFGCAVLTDGGVSCWGNGNMGELGRQVEPFVAHPAARVPGLSGMAQVVASGHTACARSVDGVVSCWGRNMACELGVKKRKVGDLSERPLVVEGLEPSQKLSFNGRVVCSLSRTGNLTCWGGCLADNDNDPSVRLPTD